jgi:hypothetical protein
MELSGSLSAWSRRVAAVAGLAAVVTAGSVVAASFDSRSTSDPVALSLHGQDQPDHMVFQSDVQLVYFFIAPTHTQDFEFTMSKVREVLMKSEKPERQQQARGMRIFKVATPGNDGNISYVLMLDPVVKGLTYDVFKILAEGLPYDDVKQLYDKLQPGYKGASPTNVSEIKSAGMN